MEADKTITTPDNKAKTPAPARPKQTASGPGWMAWGFVLVIALAGALGAAYLWHSNDQQQQSVRVQVEAAIQRVDSEAGQARDLQRDIDQQKLLSTQLEKNLQQSVENLQRVLNHQQQKLQSLTTTDRGDWLLAEVEYLLRLANQRLMMGEDAASAMRLLEAADKIIKELDEPALYPVRKVLAEEIAALKVAGTLDKEGLYLQLAAVAGQAARLRLYQRPEFETATVDATPAGDWQQKLGSGFAAAWEKLSSYIKIHKRDQKYQPVLAPEYEAAVRQNVQLMFEQAQLALLSGKQKIYADSLAKASRWLRDYYIVDMDATVAVAEQIDTLQKENIVAELPDISRSLRELKNTMATVQGSIPDKSVGEPAL